MNTLNDHIEARRRDYQYNAENMRQELRALAAFLARIDGELDDCTTEQVSRHVESVQTIASRMDQTLARYTETRAALGALLKVQGK